jgi:hypothetical protein
MAVNYANALADEIFSGLVSTRKESLVNQINSNVEYLFLGRKTFDTKAYFDCVVL